MVLTVREVAERLKISLSLAYRLVATGEIACHQIASCKRVTEEELNRYLERTRVEITKLPPNRGKHF